MDCPYSYVAIAIACEQAHLVCYSREYLGGGSQRAKRAGEKNGSSRHSSRRFASLADCRRQDTRDFKIR